MADWGNSGGDRRGRKRQWQDEAPVDSAKAAKMMRLMGYRPGEGLGKNQQGIREPVKAEQRKGRQGLGHKYKFEEEDLPEYLEWNVEEHIPEGHEKFEWIPDFEKEEQKVVTFEELKKNWLKVGTKKLKIDDETHFVDPEILKWVLKCKSALDDVTSNELFHARKRSNPYETIGKWIFQNRAAMKMANIDAVLNFEITNPRNTSGDAIVGDDNLLYFADICAGPGGFSEYILWKKNWHAKGFGFTLKGDNDFKLHNFISGPPESFEPHYGIDEDGDIYKPHNCQEFIKYVLRHSDGEGVHFVMADGGFSVEGQENIQEILSKQLYLSQALVAVGIVRKGGHFICKLFDVFTPFSVGLVYVMRLCFEKVCLLKPVTSRPANSERYLICKWRKDDVSEVYEYLRYCHERMWEWTKEKEDMDIVELVPLAIIKEEELFFNYVKQDNDKTGISQIQNLRKLSQHFFDQSLRENKQGEIRKACLERWGLDPGIMRISRDFSSPEDKFHQILNIAKISYHEHGFEKSTDQRVNLHDKDFRSPYNWKLCVVENSESKKYRCLYMSIGRSRIYRLNPYGRWELLDHFCKFEMSDNTLLYGEIVTELFGDCPNQKKVVCFHIIDAMVLGGKNINDKSLMERRRYCSLFAKSMNKSYQISGLGAFRAKELVPMERFRELKESMIFKTISGSGNVQRMVCPVSINSTDLENTVPFIQVSGLIFLQKVQDPWLMAFSRSQGRMYYFNTKNGMKSFEPVSDAFSNFTMSIKRRMFWEIKDKPEEKADVGPTKQSTNNEVYAEDITEFLDKITREGVK